MLPLDRESAELMAAQAVREAFSQFPSYHSGNIDTSVLNLWAAGHVDGKSATYVLRNADRFCMLAPPRYIDAKWHETAEHLAESMNPFG
jgi:hypothetical protein